MPRGQDPSQQRPGPRYMRLRSPLDQLSFRSVGSSHQRGLGGPASKTSTPARPPASAYSPTFATPVHSARCCWCGWVGRGFAPTSAPRFPSTARPCGPAHRFCPRIHCLRVAGRGPSEEVRAGGPVWPGCTGFLASVCMDLCTQVHAACCQPQLLPHAPASTCKRLRSASPCLHRMGWVGLHGRWEMGHVLLGSPLQPRAQPLHISPAPAQAPQSIGKASNLLHTCTTMIAWEMVHAI